MSEFDYTVDRIVETLEMANVIAGAHSMPPLERADELRRLARRLDSHVTHLEIVAEAEGRV